MPYEDIIRVVELYSADEVNEYLSRSKEDWVLIDVIDGRKTPDKPCFAYCLGLIAPLINTLDDRFGWDNDCDDDS